MASPNVFVELGFSSSTGYTLWALTGLTLRILVLYGLIVRWDDNQP